MKKNLLLLAAISATGLASAQSSVTLFGVVDITMARGTGSLTSLTQMSRGGNASNRLGFRGTEDLGGGMAASFWVEAGINLDDGSGQATNTNNQASGATVAGGLTFARRSTVSLQAGWGEIRLGRDFTPQYTNMLAGDPFGEVGVGSTVNFTNIITGVTNTRASNMVQYFSPNMNGFAAVYGHYFGENPSGTATAKDGTGDGIRGLYQTDRWGTAIATSRTSYAAGGVRQSNANVNGKFGDLKLMLTLVRDSNGSVSARGGQVGALLPVGSGDFKAGYSWYRLNSAGNPEGKKLAVGYVYNLSKRTALYGTLARVNNAGGAAFALNGSTTAANKPSTGLDLGFRVTF